MSTALLDLGAADSTSFAKLSLDPLSPSFTGDEFPCDLCRIHYDIRGSVRKYFAIQEFPVAEKVSARVRENPAEESERSRK